MARPPERNPGRALGLGEQFTALLAKARDTLNRILREVDHEYLDGRSDGSRIRS